MLAGLAIFDLIPAYGLAVATGFLLALVYARQRAVQRGIDVAHMDLLVPLMFAIGIAGARLLPRVTGDLGVDDLDPLLARSRVFGMLALAIPTVFVYCRINRLPVGRMLDVLALPLIVWLCCVRVGCFVAGCCWGDVVNSEWLPAVEFPFGSPAHLQQLSAGVLESHATHSLPVHPTQVYELAVLLVALVVLTRIERGGPQPGVVATAALAMYATARFGIEFLRADNSVLAFGLSVPQLIACFSLTVAAAVLGRRYRVG